MIKRLFNVLVLTLAMNFVAIAAGVGWLYRSKHLDHERAIAIRDILFPKPVHDAPTTWPTQNPRVAPEKRPSVMSATLSPAPCP